MSAIGFVTCASHPDIAPDDGPLREALERRGHRVEAMPWNGDERCHEAFDVLLLRSAWDVWSSGELYSRYLGWLERVESEAHMWNGPTVARWTLDKRYICDLRSGAVRIPETVVVEPGSIAATMEQHRWAQAIFKPAIGASGDFVELIDRDRAAALDAGGVPHTWTPWLLQQFIPGIRAVGETSIVYVDGEPAHAIRKRPRSGDFRANEGHGSAVTVDDLDQLDLDPLGDVVAAIPGPWLYARVDVVPDPEGPILLEVETGDPTLWLRRVPATADLLARALERRLPAS